jgi:hypothetical protein
MELLLAAIQQASDTFNTFLIAFPVVLLILIVVRLVWYVVQRRKKE